MFLPKDIKTRNTQDRCKFIVCVLLVADQVVCVRKDCGAWTTHCSVLSYQWTGLLVD